MVKKYKFYVWVASCVCLAVGIFFVDFSGPLFDPQYKLKKEAYALLREQAVRFGATDETFKDGKIRTEDFYKNKTIFEGGFLGDRKFEIPKSYLTGPSDIVPGSKILSNDDHISISYDEPHKIALIETIFTRKSESEYASSGEHRRLVVSSRPDDSLRSDDSFVMWKIAGGKLSPPDNLFDLVAYKFPLHPGTDPNYKGKGITYFEYEGGVAKSYIDCHWDATIQVETPDGLCEKEPNLESFSRCQIFKEKKNRPPRCTHFFADQNMLYFVNFPFSDLKNWKQNRVDTIKFFNGFEIKSADGSK